MKSKKDNFKIDIFDIWMKIQNFYYFNIPPYILYFLEYIKLKYFYMIINRIDIYFYGIFNLN